MLVLSRKSNESLMINGHIKVVILEIRGNYVRIGIEAPRDVGIVRTEISQKRVTCDEPTHSVETVDETPGKGCSVAIDSRSVELLHQFCERRNAWRAAQKETLGTATDDAVLCAVS